MALLRNQLLGSGEKRKEKKKVETVPGCWKRGNRIAHILLVHMSIIVQVITFHQAEFLCCPFFAVIFSLCWAFLQHMVFLAPMPLGFLERHCKLELDPEAPSCPLAATLQARAQAVGKCGKGIDLKLCPNARYELEGGID